MRKHPGGGESQESFRSPKGGGLRGGPDIQPFGGKTTGKGGGKSQVLKLGGAATLHGKGSKGRAGRKIEKRNAT